MKQPKLLSTVAMLSVAIAATAQTPTAEFCKELRTKTVVSSPSREWVQFGPGMSGNNKIAFWHPTDPNVLFISPNMGNSYRSTDGGVTYQTVLNEDAPAISSGERGPKGFNSLDFSRQSPEFGLSTSTSFNGLYVTNNMGASWEYTPNKMFDGIFLSDICVDPKDDNIWYMGSGNIRNYGRLLFSAAKPHSATAHEGSCGKIWKSTNRGKDWSLINNGINPKAEIESLMIDPVNSNIVYAATTYGFYISSDGGNSWKESNNGLDTNVLRSFDSHYDAKNDKLTFYVIASVEWKLDGDTIADQAGGVFVSQDRGASWQNINGDVAIDMTQFEDDPSIKRGYVHAAAYYFSMPDSEFAEKYPKMPKSITQSFNQITVDPNDPNNIYVVNMYANMWRNNFMPAQLWRTTDGGKHWYVAFRNGKNWVSGNDLAYWKSRNNPVGNNVTFQYLDTWMARDSYDRKSCNFTRFNCDGTILHTQMAKISMFSYDKGDTWVDVDDVRINSGMKTFVGAGNSNLPGHGFYQDLRLPGQVFCCAGENSLWITRDGGESVRPGAQAASIHTFLQAEQSLSSYAIHPRDTTIRYAMFFRQESRGKFLRSVDSGNSWQEYGTAVPLWEIKAHGGDQPSHQINLMIDEANPDNIYFCVPKNARTIEYVGNSEAGLGVTKSSDGGLTWSECNNGLTESRDVTAICFDPHNFNTLYASVQGADGGLFVSNDQGDNWKEVASTSDISGEFGINDIHFDVDGKAYITSGYSKSGAEDGGVWVSDDNMKSWKRIFNFPYVFCIETAHYDSDVILISTLPNSAIGGINAGTYLSEDGGKNWIKFNTGNGQSDRINDIAIDNYVKGKFYVSTYGSGWYVSQK